MAEFNKKQTFLRLNFFEGESVAESPFIEVDSLPENGEVGEVYRLARTGELYCYLTASVFDWTATVQTYANEQQAYAVIGELMGYDTCHILFTAVNSFGEEFSCIIYTNSYDNPYTGFISSMQGSGDYGNGYGNNLGGAYELLNGDITFSRLMYNADLGNYDSGTVTITNVTPLGQKLFDFSTGGKVNITEGKVIK
jgi:hypothetical protein